jgi:hypothetical protein
MHTSVAFQRDETAARPGTIRLGMNSLLSFLLNPLKRVTGLRTEHCRAL